MMIATGDSWLSPGAAAPDLTLVDEDGRQVRLADLWQQRPLVLLFVRHFG
jgi:peroxiredoxin